MELLTSGTGGWNNYSYLKLNSYVISVLIYQHRIAAFKCRRCGCKMEKYRDPDTSEVTLYYACDRCRIYWENKAVSSYPA